MHSQLKTEKSLREDKNSNREFLINSSFLVLSFMLMNSEKRNKTCDIKTSSGY